MNYLSALFPEITLLTAGCVSLFLGLAPAANRRTLVAAFSLIVVVLLALWETSQLFLDAGSFHTNTVITVDSLSHYVRLIALWVGAVLLLVNWYQAHTDEQGEYFSMVLFSLAGVLLVAASNDLILLFFALELVSVPTYILVALSRTDIRAQEACAKYFFLGALAAALTAYGFSFLYGLSGTTLLTGPGSIAEQVAGGHAQGLALVALMLSIGGLCYKIAAVPFHAYVGDVYQGAAAPLAGLLAFIPKLAGFIGLIKVAGAVDWNLPAFSLPLSWSVWIIAAATMTVGNVLALMQKNVKRMLAYSSVAHSGYMLIGLLVGPVAGQGPLHDGYAAMLFYIAVYGLMNLGAFTVIASLSEGDRESEDQEQLAGLWRRDPVAALVLAVCMFSLMGLPPTAGFLGKVYLFSSAFSVSDTAGFGTPMIWLAVIAVVNSAIGAAYYLRIVGVCYLQPATEQLPAKPRIGLQIGSVICAVMMILFFLWPTGLITQARRATDSVATKAFAQQRPPAPQVTSAAAEP